MRTRKANILVRRAKSGDRVAFAELFQTRRPSLAQHIQRILSPRAARQEVEDVLQQTALNACGSIHHLRADDARGFYAWLIRVARNCAVSSVRARVRKGEARPEDEPAAADDEPAARRVVHTTPNAATSEQVHRTVHCLAHLRDDERITIILRGLQTANWETLAMLVGYRTEGSIKKLHARARERLRDRLARPA